MTSLVNRFAGVARVLTVFVVLALVAGLAITLGTREGKRYLTVDFPQTNSLYKGSDVRILGVPVGRVESLTPRGDSVRVRLSYPGDVRLPTDVKAVVVSPAIVGDRFVQLAPAYSGGEALAADARLGIERTQVPVELDEVYASLDDLSVALGPEGANRNGALSRLVEDSATQLEGQGAQLNLTLRNFGKLSQTLANNKDDLFGTVREVSEFVQLLETNDASVRAFFDSTAEVSEVLEGEREDLQATLEALGTALVEVRRLVRDNRDELKGNVENLQTIAEVLGRHEADIEAITINAPTALSNVALTYNGDTGTLDNRADVLELLTGALENLPSVLCNAAENLPIIGDLGEGCQLLADALESILGPLVGGIAGVQSGEPQAPDESDLEQAPEELEEELDSLLQRGAVGSRPSPDRSATSLEEMLAVDR